MTTDAGNVAELFTTTRSPGLNSVAQFVKDAMSDAVGAGHHESDLIASNATALGRSGCLQLGWEDEFVQEVGRSQCRRWSHVLVSMANKSSAW